jgi:hypothetical protein
MVQFFVLKVVATTHALPEELLRKNGHIKHIV